MAVNIRKPPQFVFSYSVYQVSLTLAFFFSSAVLLMGINCFNSRDFLTEEYSHLSWSLQLSCWRDISFCLSFQELQLLFYFLQTSFIFPLSRDNTIGRGCLIPRSQRLKSTAYEWTEVWRSAVDEGVHPNIYTVQWITCTVATCVSSFCAPGRYFGVQSTTRAPGVL